MLAVPPLSISARDHFGANPRPSQSWAWNRSPTEIASAASGDRQRRDLWFAALVNSVTASRRSRRTCTGRRADEVNRAIGVQIAQLRIDAGVSQRALALSAGIPQSYLSRIEHGGAEPSTAVLVAIADALGSDLSVRLLPGTGPRIRDHLQARIVEELVRVSRDAWKPMVEVAVWRPARGVIDLVLARPGEIAIACEVHSEVRRLEQLLRWAATKAESLPSCRSWSMLTSGEPSVPISRLLALRSTRANRDLARAFEATLRSAFPARSAEAIVALADARRPWPGHVLVWAEVGSTGARLLPGPPRTVGVGR